MWMNEGMNAWAKKQMSELMIEWRLRLTEWMTEGMNGWMCE